MGGGGAASRSTRSPTSSGSLRRSSASALRADEVVAAAARRAGPRAGTRRVRVRRVDREHGAGRRGRAADALRQVEARQRNAITVEVGLVVDEVGFLRR